MTCFILELLLSTMASDRFIRDSSTPHNELEDVKEISTQTSTQTSREPHYENGDKDQMEPKQTSLDVHIHKLSTNETSSAGGVQARIKSPDGQKNARYSWRVGNWKIVALCLAVTVPMIAFTATILWLVFAHLVADTHCPHEELCPANGTFEGNRDDGYYYVDYAAARLAFVSSWSSTVGITMRKPLLTPADKLPDQSFSCRLSHGAVLLFCCSPVDQSLDTKPEARITTVTPSGKRSTSYVQCGNPHSLHAMFECAPSCVLEPASGEEKG